MFQKLFRPRGLRFTKRGGRLPSIPFPSAKMPVHDLVEARARASNDAGAKPLWSGYKDVKDYPRSVDGERTPDQVRSSSEMGRFYSALAHSIDNPIIIEVGTAFGVSGMYWLAGIGNGHLYAFEPNHEWAAIARENLAAVSPNFTLTEAPFEDSTQEIPAADVAFIDAIHTSDFVERQYEILKSRMKPGAFIVFDDIDFSADMRGCWRRIAADADLTASALIRGRVGIIELAR